MQVIMIAHNQLDLVKVGLEAFRIFGRVVVIPGENEMEALALGALRILNGEETARTFQPACALTIR